MGASTPMAEMTIREGKVGVGVGDGVKVEVGVVGVGKGEGEEEGVLVEAVLVHVGVGTVDSVTAGVAADAGSGAARRERT